MTKRTRTSIQQTIAFLAFGVSYLLNPDMRTATVNALVIATVLLVGGYIATKAHTRRTKAITAQRDALAHARCLDRMRRYAPTGESAYGREFDFDTAA